MRTLIVSLAALSAAIGTAQADSLGEAMASAQESNPTLAAQRQRLRATRAALPQALSSALPQVSLSASANASDRDYEDPLTPDNGRNETWTS
jgi:outer membrane protein